MFICVSLGHEWFLGIQVIDQIRIKLNWHVVNTDAMLNMFLQAGVLASDSKDTLACLH